MKLKLFLNTWARSEFLFATLLFASLAVKADEMVGDNQVTVMSLNIHGYKTMPVQAGAYAELAGKYAVDVLAIQEGVNDWKIDLKRPEDYSRSEALHKALGDCWDRRYQLYVNRCRGFSIEHHERFDLADGPDAVRTGEKASISGPLGRLYLVNVHWDHESESARMASARQTAIAADQAYGLPVVVVGDFNSPCSGATVQVMVSEASLETIVDGGIDCIFLRGIDGVGQVINATPSDHPAVLVTLIFGAIQD